MPNKTNSHNALSFVCPLLFVGGQIIKKHCNVVCLDGQQDWRLMHFDHLPLYLCPNNDVAKHALQASFDELRTQSTDNEQLMINERIFPTQARAGSIVWFNFDTLCCQPTGARDYVELARCFHTIIIDNIPTLNDEKSAAVVRFIHLIDELYDRNVKVIISADAPIGQLYNGKSHAFSFARTQSRLHEMQTTAYLKRPHHP